ncbi:MAG: polyprenol monophosphomannose synthase [Candidatus Bathyarchaeales archaeon]
MNVVECLPVNINLMRNVEGDLSIVSEVGVILPTYCEASNIKNLIEEIESLNLNLAILVIDDSSPDGTAEIVRNLQKKYSNILLYVRPQKLGLGTAITDGFRIFLSLPDAPKHIVTMDADYSHNPRDVSRLIDFARMGNDLVIGSRYSLGGRIRDWSAMRLAISKLANLFASFVIGASVRDYTSGMRCYSARLVRNILGDLHSQTYEIQIETVRQTWLRGYRIREVPIEFVNRKKGKSKLTLSEITAFLSYITKSMLLRYKRVHEIG